MNNLNTVLVEGLLTRDPERMGPEGTSMCRMGIANNRYYFSDRESRWITDTSFFTIQVYGAVAEACLNRLRKGRGIRVVGRLKQYVGQRNKVEKVYIQAEHIEFQPPRNTEKLTVPELEKLEGVPITSADTKSLEDEEQEATKLTEQQMRSDEIFDNPQGGEEESIPENETIVDEDTGEIIQKEKEDEEQF